MAISDLMKDKGFVAELLNGPLGPSSTEKEFAPVNPDWIDAASSEGVTDAFHGLLPPNLPYLTYIIVERNPNTIMEGTAVEDNDNRTRYFLVVILPDTEYPYNVNFPLITLMSITGLYAWEMVRATLAASEQWCRVVLAEDAKPPILNCAKVFWTSLFLGRKPYSGLRTLSEQWIKEEKPGEEVDTHLHIVREAEESEIRAKLLSAYDEDYPVQDNQTN